MWINNYDRHPNNLSFNAHENKVVLFDHGECPFRGINPANGLRNSVDHFNITNHSLIEHLPSVRGFREWFWKIVAIPEELIRMILTEAIDLGLPPELVAPGTLFLVFRRFHLMRLILGNLHLFCRKYMTLKTTPAVAAGLTNEPWTLERLLNEAAKTIAA